MNNTKEEGKPLPTKKKGKEMEKDLTPLGHAWERIKALEDELAEVQEQLAIALKENEYVCDQRDELVSKLLGAIRTLQFYADERNWLKTPTLTQWTLNPNASLLAKTTLQVLGGIE